MKPLQTGTKVLIEATVESIASDNSIIVKAKSGYTLWLRPSDLTVCETAEPIDINNFCIDITDPVNAELLPVFKEWFLKNYDTQNSHHYQYYEVCNGLKSRTNHYDPPHYLTTLPELQKQHPGVFEPQQISPKKWKVHRSDPHFMEVGKAAQAHSLWGGDDWKKEAGWIFTFNSTDENGYSWDTDPELSEKHKAYTTISGVEALKLMGVNPTPSFKAGQEVEILDSCVWVKAYYIGPTRAGSHVVEYKTLTMTILPDNIRPIPAQPTVESELLEIIEGVESCRYSTELAVEKILAWHQKYTRLSSELRNLLEDVVNELELSDGMIEKHGPLGTEPSKLVRLVLDQKDQQIKALKAGMIDIKHSGRVEVSDEIPEGMVKVAVIIKHPFRDYDYRIDNYLIPSDMPHKDLAEHARSKMLGPFEILAATSAISDCGHFMTRKEQQG